MIEDSFTENKKMKKLGTKIYMKEMRLEVGLVFKSLSKSIGLVWDRFQHNLKSYKKSNTKYFIRYEWERKKLFIVELLKK